MKRQYIKPSTNMAVLHSQSHLLALSAHTSTDPYGGEAGVKEVEIHDVNLWDKNRKGWEDDEEE